MHLTVLTVLIGSVPFQTINSSTETEANFSSIITLNNTTQSRGCLASQLKWCLSKLILAGLLFLQKVSQRMRQIALIMELDEKSGDRN